MTTTNLLAARAGFYRVGDLDLNRIGYGTMQLAGPGVLGPPHDRAAAVEVLRTAVELGVNHIDTADAYGPYITNEIIREALFPYGDDVHIVTKVGVVRDDQGGRLSGNSPESLRAQVHDNLRRLGLDVLDVVNFRTLAGMCPTSRSAASRRYSPMCCPRSPSGSARTPWRSPSPGCCSTRRTSC
ncbi:MAG: oxidoreductase [Microbacteriaceae bacterium]|nr:oxidoreductase [Microbacteriaceae bacterium]